MNLSDLLYHFEKTAGTLINVDPLHPAMYHSEALKLPLEQQIHRSPFCEFAKRCSRGLTVSCFKRKKETRALAGQGRGGCQTCPFGIQEWIEPVIVDGEHAATLYLGPFSSAHLHTRIGEGVYQGKPPPLLPDSLKELQEAARFIATFIRTEIEFWIADGNNFGKQKSGSFYRNFSLRYIEGHYRDDIQLTDLAETLKLTPNYASTRIRQECGKTFRQLLTEKRMAVACTCLEFELDMRITEIALQVGYNDSNYFSTAFRKQMGVSPRAFRDSKQTG